MKRLKIGFMSISKASWLTPKIQKLADAARASLDVLDADIVSHGVTSTEPEAIARAAEFVEQGVDVPEEAVSAGLRDAWMPGRMQVVRSNPTVILDGAHNQSAASALAWA